MKKSIGELKFPFAESQTIATVDSSTVDVVDARQFLDLDYEEIEDPEENWMNMNKHATSQSVVTLQKSKPRSRRSKFSILNAQNITICQSVPVLANGFTGGGMETKNTCAFDCIFSAFASLYGDYRKFQALVDDFQSSSEFCSFIRKVMTQKKVLKQTYIERNNILYGLAGQSGKITKLTSLNCEAGFGGVFTNICKKNEVFASSILLRTCGNCDFESRLVRPLFPFAAVNLDLKNLQLHIFDPTLQQETCPQCKNTCNSEHLFGPVLALEVEAISSVTSKKYKVGDLTPQIEVDKKIWNLCGLIEGTGNHFICHMLRKNNVWETYDDLSMHVTLLDTSREFQIFMIFYLCTGKFPIHFSFVLFCLKIEIDFYRLLK